MRRFNSDEKMEKVMDFLEKRGLINVVGIAESSLVNGPGRRTVIWVQGCKKRCVGCYNPHTWNFEVKNLFTPRELYEVVIQAHEKYNTEGITLSGGEPILQARSLINFLKLIKESNLSVVCFSGYYLDEIKKMKDAKEILKYIDVLIAGPYEQDKHTTNLPLVSSTNQELHFLTNRYSEEDLKGIGDVEIYLTDHSMIITGFPSKIFLEEIRGLFNDMET